MGEDDVELVGLWEDSTRSQDRFGIFIDPARRMGGRRLAGGESSPSLEWCFSLAEGGGAVADAGRNARRSSGAAASPSPPQRSPSIGGANPSARTGAGCAAPVTETAIT